jgi:hypothetical protein
MVSIAQLVRAPGCGPGGQGFKSLYSPKLLKVKKTLKFSIFHFYYLRPHRLMVRTSPFHGGNMGSNPVGVTNKNADYF